MYLENGKISERQCFRIGVLENVALGIVLIPYITANVAGDWHFPSLVIGLIFTGIYATVVYFLSKGFPEGMISYISESLGIFGKIIQGIYILRYAVRGGLIIIFFGSIIQEYMLRSFDFVDATLTLEGENVYQDAHASNLVVSYAKTNKIIND